MLIHFAVCVTLLRFFDVQAVAGNHMREVISISLHHGVCPVTLPDCLHYMQEKLMGA